MWFLSADELAATRTKMTALNQRAARKGFTGNIEVHAAAGDPQPHPGHRGRRR